MIFYLSCTGNTLWAVRQIAAATGEEMVDIANSEAAGRHFTLKEGERIGFCFPVHCWRPPVLFRQFVKGMHIESAKGHFTFALCTAGDDIGRSIDILKRDLQPVDIALDRAWSLVMPETYVGLPFVDIDTKDNEQRKIAASQQRLNVIIPEIKNRRLHGTDYLDVGGMASIKSGIVAEWFNRWWVDDKRFRVDSSHCTGCGRCAKVCPVGDIRCEGEGNNPSWQHNGRCLTCLSCYHHCPAHAISFARQTNHKGQYYFNKKQ